MVAVAEQLAFDGFLDRRLPKPRHASPIVKWLGGKRWLVKHASSGIYQRLAKTGGRYVEPFLGGAALALDLGLPMMLLSDTCKPLIDTYRAVRDHPAQVAWALSTLATRGVDEKTYYQIRDEYNAKGGSKLVYAARFIYLNKIGFNGVYRENSQGAFNVPYGKQPYRKSTVNRRTSDSVERLFPSAGMLNKFADAMKQADLRSDDFRLTLSVTGKGSVVYADPPYAKTFDGYTADGFGPADQEDLANALRGAWERGAAILATNSDCPEIRELYSWATVMSTAEARSVSQDGSKRKRTDCLLICSPGDEVLLGT